MLDSVQWDMFQVIPVSLCDLDRIFYDGAKANDVNFTEPLERNLAMFKPKRGGRSPAIKLIQNNTTVQKTQKGLLVFKLMNIILSSR